MFQDEKKIRLSEAAKRYPAPVAISAVWRHCRLGLKARNGIQVKLEHYRVGGLLWTSVEAIDRFFRAMTAADNEYFDEINAPTPRQKRTPNDAERQKAIDNADAELEAAGI